MDSKKTTFNPPYDSPIEEEFIRNFIKYIDLEIETFPQHEIKTSHGCFKLDFAIKVKDKFIGIECDGKDFHNIGRDTLRDIIIIDNSSIADIFRFRGSDITYFLNECLLIISWVLSRTI